MAQINSAPQMMPGATLPSGRWALLDGEQASVQGAADFLALLAVTKVAQATPVAAADPAQLRPPLTASEAVPLAENHILFPVEVTDQALPVSIADAKHLAEELPYPETDFAYFSWTPAAPAPVAQDLPKLTGLPAQPTGKPVQSNAAPIPALQSAEAEPLPVPGLPSGRDLLAQHDVRPITDAATALSVGSLTPPAASAEPPANQPPVPDHTETAQPINPSESASSASPTDLPLVPPPVQPSPLAAPIIANPKAELAVRSRQPGAQPTVALPMEEGLLRSLWPSEPVPEEVASEPPAQHKSLDRRGHREAVPVGPVSLPFSAPSNAAEILVPSEQESVQIRQAQPHSPPRQHATAEHAPVAKETTQTPGSAVSPLSAAPPDPIGIDSSSIAPTAHLPAVAGAHRSDTAPVPVPTTPTVHLQIAQAVSTTTDGVTELRLSPEELGQVRIDLRSDGDRLVVAVSAERPETLDLLRRHADLLSAELRSAGQNQLDLSFGRWSGRDTGQKPADAAASQPEPEPLTVPLSRPAPSQHSATGLYLRI